MTPDGLNPDDLSPSFPCLQRHLSMHKDQDVPLTHPIRAVCFQPTLLCFQAGDSQKRPRLPSGGVALHRFPLRCGNTLRTSFPFLWGVKKLFVPSIATLLGRAR